MAILEWGSAIKVTFDLPIATALGAPVSTEYYTPVGTSNMFSTTPNASYPLNNAVDNNNSTYWRSSSTSAGQFIGRDFGQEVALTKVSARFDYSSGRPNAYVLQGSNDNSSWTNVASGNFANASGWQDVIFSVAAFRYWRLYFSSRHSSYYSCSEIKFYNTRNTYDVSGWSVAGFEPDASPRGILVPAIYPVRKITKTDDDFSVVLWLHLANRMKHPIGSVTVNFTGTLQGLTGGIVAAFSIPFTPSNIDPVFNPNAVCAINIASVAIMPIHTKVIYSSNPYYLETKATQMNSVSITAVRTHIDDLNQ